MLVVGPVIARIEAQVPALAGRVGGAAQYAALQRDMAAPQHSPAAYVLPAGVIPTSTQTGYVGQFVQPVDRLVSVVLYLQTWTQTGGARLPDLEQLVEDVTLAVCAWDPESDLGTVFRLARSQMLAFQAGTAVWGLDFALPDHVRIAA